MNSYNFKASFATLSDKTKKTVEGELYHGIECSKISMGYDRYFFLVFTVVVNL